jgi:dienelactone hydrolase
MASNPPGPCCARGHLFEGEPTGKLIKLEDGKTDAYIATPAADKAKKDCGLLYIPDVIGIWKNSKLMADLYAAEGYTTIVLDIFNGDPVPLNRPDDYDLFAWIQKGSDGNNPHTTEYVDPIIVSGIKTLKAQGIKNIGAVGYCFGAKVSIPCSALALAEEYVSLTCRSTWSATIRMASRLATPPILHLLKMRSLLPSLVPSPFLQPR